MSFGNWVCLWISELFLVGGFIEVIRHLRRKDVHYYFHHPLERLREGDTAEPDDGTPETLHDMMSRYHREKEVLSHQH